MLGGWRGRSNRIVRFRLDVKIRGESSVIGIVGAWGRCGKRGKVVSKVRVIMVSDVWIIVGKVSRREIRVMVIVRVTSDNRMSGKRNRCCVIVVVVCRKICAQKI